MNRHHSVDRHHCDWSGKNPRTLPMRPLGNAAYHFLISYLSSLILRPQACHGFYMLSLSLYAYQNFSPFHQYNGFLHYWYCRANYFQLSLKKRYYITNLRGHTAFITQA